MNVNRTYTLMHSCMGMICSVAFGYNAFYLGEFGFDAGEIGILLAVSNVVTALCLPVFGRIADRSKVFNWRTLMFIFTALSVAVWTALLFCSSKPVVGVLFQTGGLLISCMYPMINVACFYYAKRNIHVDYGIARGMNSLVYAIGAFLLGQLTVRMGSPIVAILGVMVSLLIFWPVIRMPYLKDEEPSEAAVQKEVQKEIQKDSAKKKEQFWKKYPAFTVMVIGSVLMMTVFNLTTTFLIQIISNVGGDSSHLGIALAICAGMEVPTLMLFTHIVKRISVTKLLIISGIMYFVKSVVLFCAGNVWMIYAAQLLQPFSYALYASASVYFSDQCMEEEDATTGQSLLSMCGCAGSVIGSLLGGWMIEHSGVRLMLTTAMIMGVLSTSVICISMKMYHKERRQKAKV